MGNPTTFDELLDLARRLGVVVRHVHLGGSGGGMVSVKGNRQLFIDLDACAIDQLDQTARAIAAVPGLDGIFVRPDVRQIIEEYQQRR